MKKDVSFAETMQALHEMAYAESKQKLKESNPPEEVLKRLADNVRYNSSPAISYLKIGIDDAKVLLGVLEESLKAPQSTNEAENITSVEQPEVNESESTEEPSEKYVYRYFLDDIEIQIEGYVVGTTDEEALKNTGWGDTETLYLTKIAPLSALLSLGSKPKIDIDSIDWDEPGYLNRDLKPDEYRNGEKVENTQSK